MSAEFWENLPAILKEFGVMSVAILTAAGLFWQQRRHGQKLEDVVPKVSEKVDSKVDSAAKEIKKEAAAAVEVTAEKTKEAAQGAAQGAADNAQFLLDGIAKMFGDTLVSHGQRIATVEKEVGAIGARIEGIEGKTGKILEKLGDPPPPGQIRERM